MKNLLSLLFLLAASIPSNAELQATIAKTQRTGDKAVITITLKNTFSEPINSARATVFLIGEAGKVAGYRSAWVIGGSKERKPLGADKSAKYNFVITTKKAFKRPLLKINRIILASGRLVTSSSKLPLAAPKDK